MAVGTVLFWNKFLKQITLKSYSNLSSTFLNNTYSLRYKVESVIIKI